MRIFWQTLLSLAIAAPIFAGALTMEVGNPANSPEAKIKHLVLVARTTACHSPAKTDIRASAEGLVGGRRKSIPLTVIRLSTPGTFGVTREWPEKGVWTIKLVATNPDYKNYATGVLAPVEGDAVRWATVKHYFHAPAATEIEAVLGGGSMARQQVN
ncbi:MAG: hypothetical protein WB676_03110 [Bryobacteraceae bacterium]